MSNLTTSRFVSRRRFLGTLGALAGGWLAAGCGAPSAPATQPGSLPVGLIGPTVLPTAVASPVKGRLMIVQDGNFQAYDLSTLSAQPMTKFPRGSYGASPSLSFDRKSVAYTYYVVPKDPKDLGGSDLNVMDAAGTNPRTVRAHPESGATFEDPCFTADGKAILATLRKEVYDQGQFKGESVSIQRIDLDGSGPTPVVDNALGPAISPDGKYLVYTGVDEKGQPIGLRIASGNGSGGKDLLANQGFTYARFPVFSPDGSLILFSAVGGPGISLPSPKVNAAPFGVGIAEAHGIPWDIWTVRPDGSDVKRLTNESEDTPVPVWSPKGDWVAFAGEIGLYLVDAGGKQTIRISTTISGGGIVWLD